MHRRLAIIGIALFLITAWLVIYANSSLDSIKTKPQKAQAAESSK